MKTKSMTPLQMEGLVAAMAAKRDADAVASAAKKTLDAIKGSLTLEHADYVLRSPCGGEVLASFVTRNVRASEARTDYFHTLKVVEK